MSLTLHPLNVKDQFKAHQYLKTTVPGKDTPLASWAFPPHYIWKNVLEYSWAEVDGWWCLFGKYEDHLFLALPPQGPRQGMRDPSASPFQEILSNLMDFLDARNAGAQFSRIENVPAELKDIIQPWGYTLIQNDSDYLYRTTDLVQLKAHTYKSQRAAYNRFSRAHRLRIVPYQLRDRDGCLALYQRWANQQEDIAIPQVETHTEIARLKRRETLKAHRVVLQEYRELELTGRVVWVDGSIKAYAFGYPRSAEVFCILAEVADRSIPGLAQYLFREYCREIQQYPFINTMTDLGLPNVTKVKHAYRPTQLVSNYMAQRA